MSAPGRQALVLLPEIALTADFWPGSRRGLARGPPNGIPA
jgi:primosomal protein N'